MIYLVVQDWSNTSKNHAGIKYLCNRLQQKHPDEFKVILIPDYYQGFSDNLLLRRISIFLARRKFFSRLTQIFKELHAKLNTGDKVFLMEYMEQLCPQVSLAERLKNSYPQIPIYAMVHLVPEKLNDNFSHAEYTKWIKPIDYIVTLGSSLTRYFIERGFNKSKIITTFHYVENDYYKVVDRLPTRKSITVIAMGNQMRNVALLHDIVLHLPQVKFIICQGVGNMENEFADCTNVSLIPFVSEDKLRDYMASADVSLNVMKDTIGSNVIVTSMAMGLAMVCSDVGSIRDYCNDSNCLFANTTQDFVKAILYLSENVDRLKDMKQASLNKSADLTIDKFYDNIKPYFSSNTVLS